MDAAGSAAWAVAMTLLPHTGWLELGGALESAVGERCSQSEHFAAQVWSALANKTWRAPDGREFAWSFREAGAAVAAIRDVGETYIDWYCSASPRDDVDPEIAAAMAGLGWTWRRRVAPPTPLP